MLGYWTERCKTAPKEGADLLPGRLHLERTRLRMAEIYGTSKTEDIIGGMRRLDEREAGTPDKALNDIRANPDYLAAAEEYVKLHAEAADKKYDDPAVSREAKAFQTLIRIVDRYGEAGFSWTLDEEAELSDPERINAWLETRKAKPPRSNNIKPKAGVKSTKAAEVAPKRRRTGGREKPRPGRLPEVSQRRG